MRKILLTLLCASGAVAAPRDPTAVTLPIVFEANRGQTAPVVRFVGRAGRQTLFLTPREIVTRLDGWNGTASEVVRLEPVGANAQVALAGDGDSVALTHYLSAGRSLHVPQFARVRYRELYAGIDLVVYGRLGEVEYDLVIAPGANPSVIAFRVSGSDSPRLTRDGDLVIGPVVHRRPIAYQEIGGRRRPVAAKYELRGRDEFRFALGRWDRRHPLVIDPVVVFSKTLGGSQSGLDVGYAVAVDAGGNSYITGDAASPDFPTTSGTYLPSSGGGGVLKSIDGGATFTQSNNGMAASTECGNPFYRTVTAIAIAPATPTTLYAGVEQSGQGAFKSTDAGQTWALANNGLFDQFGFGASNVRAIAINPSTPSTVLLSSDAAFYRTTNGGTSWTKINSGPRGANRIAIDPQNTQIAYADTITSDRLLKTVDGGVTWTPVASYQISASDVLIDPVTPSTVYVLSGTLMKSIDSGATWNPTAGVGETVVLDPSSPSTLYMSQLTAPATFAIKKSTNGGTSFSPIATITTPMHDNIDSLLVIDKATPSTLYFYPLGMQKDVLGIYKSTNNGVNWTLLTNGLPRIGPTSVLAVHPTSSSTLYAGGGPLISSDPIDDAFVMKLSPSGSILWSTYLGGRGNDRGRGIALDAGGNVWVAGYTISRDFPVTGGAAQGTFAGGEYYGDGFVAKLDPSGASLLYGSYLGGSSDERILGLAADSSGAVYLTGYTNSSNYPEVAAAYGHPGTVTANAFVTKLTSAGAIAYSTYLGGGGADIGLAIAVDSSNAAYVAGFAGRVFSGSAFPVTATIAPSPSSDAFFVAKFAANGSASYSTIVGPKDDSTEQAGIAVDSAGAAYATVASNGALPTASPIYAYNAGTDVWIGKLNATGTALVYATYLGGTSTDSPNAIVVNGAGEAIAIGRTLSSNFPQVASNTTTAGLFATKINAAGSALVYSSLLGHTRTPRGALLPPSGDVYIVTGPGGGPSCSNVMVLRISEPVSAPPAPTGLIAEAVTATRADLSWAAAAGATSYQIDRRGAGQSFAQIGTSNGPSYSDTTASANAAYLYRVRAVGAGGTSGSSVADLATMVIFTDASLGNVAIKAVHLAEVRTAVNAVRSLAVVGTMSFTDAASPGTVVKAVHVTEVRSGLDAALTALGIATSGYTNPSLGGVTVAAVHFQELRNRVR